MKKIILLFLTFTFLSFTGIGQTNDSIAIVPNKVNELKLNAPLLLAGYLEISYERNLKNESSYGIAIGKNLNSSFPMNFAITPYYRAFFDINTWFGSVNNFFVEANASIYQDRDMNYDYSNPVVEYKNNSTKFGMGFGAGGKFENRHGFLVEFVLGMGRDLTNLNQDNFYPRVGFSVGKKF